MTPRSPVRTPDAIRDMFQPVQCGRCFKVYDLGMVTVTARYADCSVWNAPCCGAVVDDRPAGWKSRTDFIRLDRQGCPV